MFVEFKIGLQRSSDIWDVDILEVIGRMIGLPIRSHIKRGAYLYYNIMPVINVRYVVLIYATPSPPPPPERRVESSPLPSPPLCSSNDPILALRAAGTLTGVILEDTDAEGNCNGNWLADSLLYTVERRGREKQRTARESLLRVKSSAVARIDKHKVRHHSFWAAWFS